MPELIGTLLEGSDEFIYETMPLTCGDDLEGGEPVPDDLLTRLLTVERDGRRVRLGLGPERALLALLSRWGLLAPLLRPVLLLLRRRRRWWWLDHGRPLGRGAGRGRRGAGRGRRGAGRGRRGPGIARMGERQLGSTPSFGVLPALFFFLTPVLEDRSLKGFEFDRALLFFLFLILLLFGHDI